MADIDSHQLVTVQLLRDEDVQSQVKATVELAQTTAPIQVTSFLKFLQVMYRSNTLVSDLGTNAMALITSWHIGIVSTYYWNNNSSSLRLFELNCAVKNSVTPAAFYSVSIYDSVSYRDGVP